MDKDVNKNRTKNILRNICIATVVLFIGIIMVVKSFKVDNGSSKILYSYNIGQNVTYKVGLAENQFFETKELEMNKTYISSLVDKINMNLVYTFSGNKKAKTKYSYKVIGVTDIRYNNKDEKSIWSKEYVLVEPKELETDGNSFTINENFDVDYATYNNEVKQFKADLKIPIVADFQVKVIINSQSDVSGVEQQVAESSILNLKMNLAEDIFTVDKQFENQKTNNVYENTMATKKVNKPLLIIGSIAVFAALLLILDAIRKSIKFSKRTDYAIALNRILKNYGDIVAEIVTPVEMDNLNVIEVKNFDQLLDIEEEIRMPILFYEIIPDEQGEFVIVCDNVAYRYVIGR